MGRPRIRCEKCRVRLSEGCKHHPRRAPVAPKMPAVVEKGSGEEKESLLASLRTQEATVVRQLESSEKGAEAAQLSNALSRIRREIGLLTGEGEISEAKVVASPAFQRVLVVLKDALTPYPTAAKAVAEALAVYTK